MDVSWVSSYSLAWFQLPALYIIKLYILLTYATYVDKCAILYFKLFVDIADEKRSLGE